MTQKTSLQVVVGTPTTEGPAWETFQSLMGSAKHPSKKAHLQHIWDALESLRGKKQKTFTVAAVCRALEAAGTPLAQSTVRNAQGADYRTLIAAYAAQVTTHRGTRPDDADVLLDGITDAHIAVRINQLKAERNGLKRQVEILQSRFQMLTTMAPAVDLSPAAPPARPALPPGPAGFATRDVGAVRRFLDDGIAGLGWHIDEASGAVLDRHGSEVAGPGFVSALRQVTRKEA